MKKKRHTCLCGEAFDCSAFDCPGSGKTDSCPTCLPDAWKPCPGCCLIRHAGLCLKCHTWYKKLDKHCLACGTPVKTSYIKFECCTSCAKLPYAVTRSMIQELRKRTDGKGTVPVRCKCNKCGGER